MRKFIILFSAMLVLLFVTACGNNGDNTSSMNEDSNSNMQTEIRSKDIEGQDSEEAEQGNQSNESENADESNDATDMEKANNQDDMKKMMEQLDFHEFELEVDYGDDKEYEVEIEHHRDGRVEARVKDELNDVYIDDDLEAFNHIFPYVKKLNVNKDMDKQEVIDHVLEVFELDSNYEEFEVEIEFNDGSKLKAEDDR